METFENRTNPRRESRILVEIHEREVASELEFSELPSFELDFYTDRPWVQRPNSTQRLTAANAKALIELQQELDFDIRSNLDWTPQLADVYSTYDLVVINTIASRESIRFTAAVVEWKAKQPESGPKLIIGTEGSWLAELNRGEITPEIYHQIYFDNLVLRHTARTERQLYADPSIHEARIQEFDLGIDTALFEALHLEEERKFITFVYAPEGRTTKNNAAIEVLKQMVERSEVLKGFEVKEIKPPYSLMDYWKIMSQTAFFIFTSQGETFSYALNDAKALGVITLFPQQMFRAAVGYRFAIDCYPELGIHYKNEAEAIQIMEQLVADPRALERESQRSKSASVEKFGFRTLKQNWRQLLSGEPLNTRSMMVYNSHFTKWDEVVTAAAGFGCDVVMPYFNVSCAGTEDELSFWDSENRVLRISYYLNALEDGKLERRYTVVDSKTGEEKRGAVSSEDLEQTAAYLQLVVRSYRVYKVWIPRELKGSVLERALRRVRVVQGWALPSTALEIAFYGEGD